MVRVAWLAQRGAGCVAHAVVRADEQGQQQGGQQGGLPGDADGNGTVDPDEVTALVENPEALAAAMNSPRAGEVAQQLVGGMEDLEKQMLNDAMNSNPPNFSILGLKGINDPATQQKMFQILKQQFPNGLI